jgi:hypothetical protein
METPCVKVCVIDPTNRLCRGCGRTIEEISSWTTLSSADRRRIMAELPARSVRTHVRGTS